ncbi:peptidoglycan DD-metalloendopeptidase family protein [Oscillochloris sp. ZM17-4]|nr:peptidoglycan DD-metalloendopeptidase family protein [Oscillochloris sp. ZM17-4]
MLPVAPARAEGGSLGVQEFLSQQPGPLKSYREGGRSAAAIIESNSLYYGLSPRLHLALLEATAGLISDPAPPDAALRQPFGAAGPDGFAAQVEWASRELRAGLGPYSRPPTVRFTDGVTFTLTLAQAPEGVSVQRFLAQGRSSGEWRAAVDAFSRAFARYFNNELVQIGIGGGSPASASPPDAGAGFLGLPWPAGDRVVHLAYFDHVYPTVDTGDDGNTFVVTYLNQGNVQYNGHDGHDYYFPDQPVGTPILAAADGVAYPRTHRGNGVVIEHPGGYETVYWHLSAFAPYFTGKIDGSAGVPVRAGDLIGYSGSSGFVRGTPHLHFEVRRYGKQVDPYGWYGPGPDPCAAYAGCLASTWLWSSALLGTYDFTPPGTSAGGIVPAPADDTPPVGTLAVNPPADLLFQAGLDGHPVQTVGAGFPEISGELRYVDGRDGQALATSGAGLAYPSADNLRPEAGTISLWAELPERYPANGLGRHYLIAASASPDGAPVYSGTLALRRDLLGPGESPRWTFWTVGADAASADELTVPDTLAPGWHHFAISWDAATGEKALYIDGAEAARGGEAALPDEVGPTIQIGRFTYGGAPAGVILDDLAIYGRALGAGEVADLAAARPDVDAPVIVRSRRVRLDTNAIDREGGIVAVQLGVDGEFADPQPYYDAYRWLLPPVEGPHILAARYEDRAGNTTTLTRTVLLDLAPRMDLALEPTGPLGVTALISASDGGPIMMQVSQQPSFAGADWQPLQGRFYWAWDPTLPRRLYIRLRDVSGNVTPAQEAAPPEWRAYLPVIVRRSWP